MAFCWILNGGLNEKRRYKISKKIVYNYDYIYSFLVTSKGGNDKLWLNMKHK